MYSLRVLCGLLLMAGSSALGQSKPIINKATTDRLAKDICACLSEEAMVSTVDQTAVKACFINIISEHGPNILAENKLEDNIENGRQIGLLIAEALRNDCPAYVKALESSPDQKLVNEAEALRQKGEWQRAHDQYGQLINRQLMIVDKTVLNNRGLCKIELGDYYGALADFEFAVQRDTLFAASYSNRGNAKQKLGDLNGAYADYTRALSLDSTQSVIYSNRGYVLYQAEQYEEADLDFRKAITLDPASGLEYYYRGMIGRMREKYTDTTATFFNKAVELEPTNHVYRNDRGIFHWQRKDMRAATADFTAVTKQRPDFNPAFYNLATLLLEEKQYDQSLVAIRQAIQLKADYDLYYDALAQGLLGKQKYKEALAALDKATELSPNKAGFYDRRGEVYEKMGDTPKAIEAYTQSINLYNQDGEIYFRRGRLRLMAKDQAGACEDFAQGKLLKNEDAVRSSRQHCGR